jgi:hypothetical protein
MRKWRLAGLGAGIGALLVLAGASASPLQRGACEGRLCLYTVLVAVQVETPEATTTYDATFRRVHISVARTPTLAARPQSIFARATDSRGNSSPPGQIKARVVYHPDALSSCVPWRKDYNVRGRLGLVAYRGFVEPISRRTNAWGLFELALAPPNELQPGLPCEELTDEGIGWATSPAHFHQRADRIQTDVLLGEGSATSVSSGVNSLATSVELTYYGKHPLSRLGFPIDRLWLGKGFSVTYQIRQTDVSGSVRIVFLRHAR